MDTRSEPVGTAVPEIEHGEEPNPIAHRKGRLPGWELLMIHTPDHPTQPRRYVRMFFSESVVRSERLPRAYMERTLRKMMDQLGVPPDE
jgi:hypothetical protein